MKHLSGGVRCLEEYGINYLTGEACTYSLRVLCDVSERGAQLIRTFWGLPADCPLQPNWNSKVNGEPAVGSIMLPRGVFQELMHFVLVHVERVDHIIVTPRGEMIGLNNEDEECDRYLKLARTEAWSSYVNWAKRHGGPRVGDRNVHAFSGRST